MKGIVRRADAHRLLVSFSPFMAAAALQRSNMTSGHAVNQSTILRAQSPSWSCVLLRHISRQHDATRTDAIHRQCPYSARGWCGAKNGTAFMLLGTGVSSASQDRPLLKLHERHVIAKSRACNVTRSNLLDHMYSQHAGSPAGATNLALRCAAHPKEPFFKAIWLSHER